MSYTFYLPYGLKSLHFLYTHNKTLFVDIVNELIVLINSELNECIETNYVEDYEMSIKIKFETLTREVGGEGITLTKLYKEFKDFLTIQMYEHNLNGEYKIFHIDNSIMILYRDERAI